MRIQHACAAIALLPDMIWQGLVGADGVGALDFDPLISAQDSEIADFKIGARPAGADQKFGGGGQAVVIPPEAAVKIVSCEDRKTKVRYKDLTGWLNPHDQCASAVTNCN